MQTHPLGGERQLPGGGNAAQIGLVDLNVGVVAVQADVGIYLGPGKPAIGELIRLDVNRSPWLFCRCGLGFLCRLRLVFVDGLEGPDQFFVQAVGVNVEVECQAVTAAGQFPVQDQLAVAQGHLRGAYLQLAAIASDGKLFHLDGFRDQAAEMQPFSRQLPDK